MIDVRDVAGDDDAETYLRLRNEIHPRDPLSPAVFAEMRARPRRLDVVALLDAEPVGVGACADHFVDPDGPLAFVNVRVLRGRRRRGVGSAILARLADHARGRGRSGFYTVVPGDDADSLEFFGGRGFERVLEMQGVALDLGTAQADEVAVRGLELRRLEPELDRPVYEAALEIEQDLQTHEPMATVAYDRWRRRQFPPHVRRDLSFALLDGALVVGYAILEEPAPGLGEHAVTGVRRAYRGRGLARALKQAQIAAARKAGLRELRATNTVSNEAMRALNERLGYRRTHLDVHLRGPLP